jgi:amino acid transporter
MFLPYLTGDFSTSNLHNNIDYGSTGDTGWTLVITWLYVMCWSSYGMECCATFAPEYNEPVRDTPMALRTAALFGVIVYSLLPLGAIGTFGDQNLSFGPNPPNNTVSFYATAFHDILGAGTGIAIILLCAGIVLAMNTATADGSRALFGIARDDMTVKWFGKLNGRHVPANAMTLDALLNIFLLFSFGSDATGALKILIFSNLGYVLCHVFAMSGFLLLRRDQPNLPRPIKVGPAWVVIAGVLAVFDLVLLVIGGWNSGLAYGVTSKRTLVYGLLVLAIGVLLYIYRVVVQDKKPLKWRLVEPPPADTGGS